MITQCPECWSNKIVPNEIEGKIKCLACGWYGIYPKHKGEKVKKYPHLLKSKKRKAKEAHIFTVIKNGANPNSGKCCLPANDMFKLGDLFCWIQHEDHLRMYPIEEAKKYLQDD